MVFVQLTSGICILSFCSIQIFHAIVRVVYKLSFEAALFSKKTFNIWQSS